MDHPNPIGRKLEELREHLGHDSIREFVDALNDRLKEPIPYATARRYHRDREPPVSYLVAVAGAFGVRLEWLLETDEWGMTEDEAGARRAEAEPNRRSSDFVLPRGARLRLADNAARAELFAVWRELAGGGSGPADLYPKLENAILGPLEALGLLTTAGEALDDYAHEVAFAIRRYVRATK